VEGPHERKKEKEIDAPISCCLRHTAAFEKEENKNGSIAIMNLLKKRGVVTSEKKQLKHSSRLAA